MLPTPTEEELDTIGYALVSFNPKAYTKPKNFIRTYDTPENLAHYDRMVERGWLAKEPIPGNCYRVTAAGKAAHKLSRGKKK